MGEEGERRKGQVLGPQLSVQVGGGEEGGKSEFKGEEGEKNMREKKKAEQTQAACLHSKGKEGREEILAACLERKVDVCSLRRPQQHLSVTVRTLVR